MSNGTVAGNKKRTRLSIILEQKNLTQAQFIWLIKEKADCVMNKSNISQHVTGKKSFMTTDTLMIFAFVLGVKADDLLDWPEGLER